jgi:glycyl-tRNA synthetase beta chain
VTNLVEWPTALVGSFEKAFLELPNEVLVTSMAVHQRSMSMTT